MKLKIVTALLILSSFCYASQLDSKSLFIGIGIGSGVYASRNVIAKPIAKATVKVAKKTASATKHIVTFGKK